MKTFIETLTNTYKAVRLLSNPTVGAYLQSHLEKESPQAQNAEAENFGVKNAFYHKHYIVQVL